MNKTLFNYYQLENQKTNEIVQLGVKETLKVI